jgi:2-keto-4-pentenoate hydratase/2-oxohepta-3-ene-1,7-dioic acid hydratase in catechol pathway
MKIIRFADKNILNPTFYGRLDDKKIFKLLNSPFDELLKFDEDSLDLNDVKLLPPVSPSKIICIATNYLGSTGVDSKMEEPVIFLKGSNAIISGNEVVHLPFKLNCWGESELGFVIKRTIKDIGSEEFDSSTYILGFLPCNDVSCSNISERDHHLARSKSADSFCPVGEFIDTTYDPTNKSIRAYHNDKLLRDGNTSEFIWNPNKIIFELSKWMTLCPGDLILTGAPKRIRDRQFLDDGDEYTVEIEGLPILKNTFTK